MASRNIDVRQPIPDDRLQAFFRAVLQEVSRGAPGTRPISSEMAGRRDQERFPLTTTSAWGSTALGFRKTMLATTEPATESYLTTVRFETYGLPGGVSVHYEFNGRASWTNPEAEQGIGQLAVSGDAEGMIDNIVALARGTLGPVA